jgi:uncharacterized membrane protein
MIAILLAAFALSVYRLDSESIWVDEGATIAAARSDTTEIIPTLIEVIDNNPPLTYLFWHYWIRLTGLSEFSLRLLSVFSGLITCALLYRMGRVLFDSRVGLLGAALLACSGFHIYYTQTVRSNSLLELLSAASFYCFSRILTGRNLWGLVVYSLVNVLLLYTHYYGVFVLLAQSIFVLIHGWSLGWRMFLDKAVHWLILQAIIILSFLPWLPMMILQGRRAVTEIEYPSAALVIGAFIEYTWSPIGFILAIGLLSVGVYTLVKPWVFSGLSHNNLAASTRLRHDLPIRNMPVGVGLVLVWMTGVIGVPVVVSALFKPIFLSRYAIAALPAFYLLLAWLACRAIAASAGRLLAGLLIVSQLSGAYFLYQNVNNEQWRDAVRYLDSAAASGDLLFFYAGIGKYSYDYYSRRADLQYAPLGLTDGAAQTQARLADSTPPGVWFVLAYRSETEFAELMQRSGYALVDRQNFFRITLLRYQRVISP